MTSTERLLLQIERAIRAGRIVTVGDRTIRYFKLNQEFQDSEGNHFQAQASGVFQQMKVYQGADLSTPVGERWVHLAGVDDLDLVLKDQFAAMSDRDRDALSLGLAFTAGLLAIRADQRSRRVTTQLSEADVDLTPSL